MGFQFVIKYGFLVARFSHRYYLFEPLGIQVRKFLVVLCTIVFRAALVKASMAALVLLSALTHVAYAKPYTKQWHNQLAVGCLLFGLVVLLGGTITYNDHLRDALILGGLACEIVLILGGIVYDLVVTVRRDKEEMEAYDGALFDDDNDMSLASFSGVSMTLEDSDRRMSQVSISEAEASPDGGGTIVFGAPANPVFGSTGTMGSSSEAQTFGSLDYGNSVNTAGNMTGWSALGLATPPPPLPAGIPDAEDSSDSDSGSTV